MTDARNLAPFTSAQFWKLARHVALGDVAE